LGEGCGRRFSLSRSVLPYFFAGFAQAMGFIKKGFETDTFRCEKHNASTAPVSDEKENSSNGEVMVTNEKPKTQPGLFRLTRLTPHSSTRINTPTSLTSHSLYHTGYRHTCEDDLLKRWGRRAEDPIGTNRSAFPRPPQLLLQLLLLRIRINANYC